MIRQVIRDAAFRAASMVAVALLFAGEVAVGQTFPTVNTGSSVTWNTTLWTGGTPPQTSTQVGLLQGGGTMTIDASSTNTTPAGLLIGWSGNFNVEMSGGTLTTGTTWSYGLTIGESGTATFTQTGGLITAPLVNLGRFSTSARGTHTLTGGTLATTQMVVGSGSGALNLNGGTIRVTGTAASLIGSTVTTTVQSGGAIVDTNGFNATVAPALSGSGGFTKNGSGTLVLSNTSIGYTGLTSVNAGVLQIGSNNANTAMPTGAIAVASGGKVIFFRNSNNLAFTTQSISGAGDVEFQGQAGGYYTFRATHTGTLSYTGQTIVNLSASPTNFANGALWLEKDNVLPSATVVNMQSGKIFLRNQSGTATGISVAGITGNAGTFITTDQTLANTQKWTVTVASGTSYTYAGKIGIVGTGTGNDNISFTKAGAGTQIFSGANTYVGTTTIAGGTLQIGDGGITGSIVSSATVSAGAMLAFRRSDALTYSGTVSGAGNLTQLGSGTLTLAADNTFSGTTRITSGGLSIGTALALQNSTLDLNAADSGVVTALGQDSTLGSLAGSRNLDMGGRTLSIGNNNTSTTYSGVLSNGSLTKVGTGGLTLSGSNTYAGATTISGGTLQIGDGGTTGWIAGNPVVSAGATLAFRRSDALTYSGTVSGAGGLTQLGSGTLTLAAANTFSGTTRIGAGGLLISTALALQNSTLDMNASDSGTIAFGQSSTLGGLSGSRNLDMGGHTLSIGNNNISTTYTGTLSNGGVTKVGTGTLILTRPSYTGGTMISSGTLQIGNNTSLFLPGLGGYSLANGSTLVFSLNGSNNSSGTATISGTGNVTFAGESVAGGWYSTGAFAANGLTYTGTTTLDLDNAANGLYVESAAGKTLPSTTILNVLRGNVYLRQNQTVAGLTGTGGTIGNQLASYTMNINVAAGASYTSATRLADASGTLLLSLTKSGSGTQILTGSSSFTGLTTISGGRLEIGSTGQIGSGTVAINGLGADFRYNSGTPLARSITFTQGTISGTGTIATAVSVGANDILSPGNSPGIQAYTQGLTFAPGGQYTWEINDWAGAAGTGYDQLAVSGSALDITATSGTTFKIEITGLTAGNVAGAVPGFSPGTTGTTFTIATSAAGITGFDKTKFTLDSATAFTNNNPLPTSAGFWLSTNTGSTSLILNYAPSATRSLAAATSAAQIIVGGTATITASVVNAGIPANNPDALSFTGLGVGNGVTLGTTAGAGIAAGGTAATTGFFTTVTAGTYTFTPNVSTATNTNIGTAALVGTTDSALVTVLDHARSSLSGTGTLTSIVLDLGTWDYAAQAWTSGSNSSLFSIFNLASSAGAALTADLSLTSFTANGGGFSTNLATYTDILGGQSSPFTVTFDPASINTPGTQTRTFTIGMADKTGLSGGMSTNTLSVTANVIVVPEPSTLALAGAAALGGWSLARRRRRAA